MNLFTPTLKKYSSAISKVFHAGLLSIFCASFILTISLGFPKPAHALPSFLQPSCSSQSCKFHFLAPINFPGFNISGGTVDVAGDGASAYIKGLYTFGIAVASALAVIVIIVGGVQYASTDAIQGKSDGKGRIQAALTGLVLALLSYTLLNTLNPQLVTNSFSAQEIVVSGGAVGGGGAVTPVPTTGAGGTNPDGTPSSPDGTWSEADRNAYFSALASGQRSTDGRLVMSTYGYSDDETPDYNTQERRGNRDNLLREGSVALSPDLISKYNPETGSSVYVNGRLVGYYEDATPSNYNGTSIVNTIDIYDPQRNLGPQLKNISGDYTLTFGEKREQISNPGD